MAREKTGTEVEVKETAVTAKWEEKVVNVVEEKVTNVEDGVVGEKAGTDPRVRGPQTVMTRNLAVEKKRQSLRGSPSDLQGK